MAYLLDNNHHLIIRQDELLNRHALTFAIPAIAERDALQSYDLETCLRS